MILRDKTMCDRKLIPEKKRNHEWQKRPLKCFNGISHFKKEKKSDVSYLTVVCGTVTGDSMTSSFVLSSGTIPQATAR